MAETGKLNRKLPFRAEYAKSGRAKCKACSQAIEKGVLRLAIMVKSRFFDGMQETWYHEPKSVGDISHFESLRWEDQKRLEKQVGAVTTMKNGKPDFSDFCVEYAKSNRSTCPACDDTIPKQALRIGKKDYESDTSANFGPAFRWYHVKCFVKIRENLDWTESGDKLPGFRDLEQIDQHDIKNELPAAAKKRKLENGGESEAKKSKIAKEEVERDKKVKEQNKVMYGIRDKLEKARDNKLLTKFDFHAILKFNKQEIPSSSNFLLDRLADIMTFGALLPCKKCKAGQYVFRSGVGYVCQGYMTEYTKCVDINTKPERVVFKVPKDFSDQDDVEFLANYKMKQVSKRVIPKHATVTVKPTSSSASATSGYKGPKIVSNPLKNFKFFVDPTLDKQDIKDKIEKLGGKLTSTISSKSRIAAAISTQDTINEGKEKFIKSCRDRKIPIVSVDFVDNLRDVDYKLTEQIQVSLIVDWIKPMEIGEYLNTINPDFDKTKEKESRMEIELKKVKLRMKDGAVVDPDSGMEDSGHVYKDGDRYYSVILSRVSLEDDINTYYKLQLIESDKRKQYFIFRSWGRLGTTVGGYQTDPQPTLEDAIDQFNDLFTQKTGNEFGKSFKLRPGKYSLMDINYGEKEKLKALVPSTKTSKLELSVQELIAKIFNIDDMQQTLLEFELDLAKMPLGKLSQKQILQAYGVLNDAIKLIEGEEKNGYHKELADVTNRFFTLIPHSFGMKTIPKLEDKEFVKSKLEMLESLMDIELAYELLVEGNKEKGSPIDAHYRTLKCEITAMEKNSETWNIIEKYLQNTHAETHDQYELELANIFVVSRKGESKRYAKFENLHNKKLLWHGSRASNYGGILSKGLRIAPPEAPVTGYMFGKGIYFADMVSKSANYCYVHPSANSTSGLLLLCKVALGDMHELTDAKDTLLKPPSGKHSVKGIGKTEPDPSENFVLPGGAVVLYGKSTKSSVKKSSLLYNEYIVYDVGQVKISYLVEVNFKFKKSRR